jgi:hypothetical protein
MVKPSDIEIVLKASTTQIGHSQTALIRLDLLCRCISLRHHNYHHKNFHFGLLLANLS